MVSSRNSLSGEELKAVTVRVYHAQGPFLHDKDREYFCRVTLGEKVQETPRRRLTAEDDAEWRCILVFPYARERWLRFDLCSAPAATPDVPGGSGPGVPPIADSTIRCPDFDLHFLRNTEGRKYRGHWEFEEGSAIKAEVSFFPRPGRPLSSGGTQPGSFAINESHSHRPSPNRAQHLHHQQKANASPSSASSDCGGVEAELEDVLHYTVSQMEEEDEEVAWPGALITIGHPKHPIYRHYPADSEKKLIKPVGPHKLGINTIWVQMAGGTVAFQRDEYGEMRKQSTPDPVGYNNLQLPPPSYSSPDRKPSFAHQASSTPSTSPSSVDYQYVESYNDQNSVASNHPTYPKPGSSFRPIQSTNPYYPQSRHHQSRQVTPPSRPQYEYSTDSQSPGPSYSPNPYRSLRPIPPVPYAQRRTTGTPVPPPAHSNSLEAPRWPPNQPPSYTAPPTDHRFYQETNSSRRKSKSSYTTFYDN